MDLQDRQAIESTLRSQWDSLWPQIAERFATVTKSDLDSAYNVDDLVTRISDKSDFTPGYVEGQISELCGVGAGSSRTFQSGFQAGDRGQGTQRPFGHSHSGQPTN